MTTPPPARARHARIVSPVLLALALALPGCTGQGSSTAQATAGASAATSSGVSAAPAAQATSAGVPPPAAPASPNTAQPGTAPAPAAPEALASGFGQLPDVIRRVEPSVVTILTGQGSGSGVVYRADGLIVTNEHVVRDVVQSGRQVQVAFADGQRIPGRVRAVDAITDLAVVQVDRQNLPAARLQPQLPRVGELAIALGSPLGLQNTATAGIISGLHREVPGAGARNPSLVDLLQTDAAISPGNSGGALVNAAGEVVGINEAYIPPAAGAVSLGFAIPMATVQDVVTQLIERGRAEHAFLGIQPATLTPEIAAQLGLQEAEGVLVYEVVSGGPAADAGLRPGDILTLFGGTPVRSVEEFLGELRQERPGNVVELQVLRAGRPETVSVTVADRPQ